MPVNNGGLRSGTTGLTPYMYLLGNDEDGGLCRRILRRGVQGFLGLEPGGLTVPNHFQCGGGHSGAPLDLYGGRGEDVVEGWGRDIQI